MSIKEKMYEYSEDDLNIPKEEWFAADCLVRIADYYAIEFAEWCDLRYSVQIQDYKELLEMFKKEKGL